MSEPTPRLTDIVIQFHGLIQYEKTANQASDQDEGDHSRLSSFHYPRATEIDEYCSEKQYQDETEDEKRHQ